MRREDSHVDIDYAPEKKKLTKITAEQLAVVLVSELQPAAAFRRLIIEKAPAG